MRMITKFFGVAAALVALTAGAHAQTVAFVGAGSSALFLQLGQAATSGSVNATCVWSRSSGNTDSLKVTDTYGGTTLTESGQAWIAWTPNGTSCTRITTSTTIYAYVQTDSVIGNRLFFNGGTLGYVTTSPSGSASSNLIFSSGEQTLPAGVWNALNGQVLTAAGTDIRPEDAKFATLRANTDCGTAVQDASGNSTQYLGLGYTTFGTSSLTSYYNSSNTFHVQDFTLPTSGYEVISVGAAPIVFAVNPSNTTSGFGTGVSNILPVTLAKFLNGTYGSTSDLTGAAGASPATVLIREPLSGTYNTVEYTSINTVGLQTSQDNGNCNGTLANTNPLHIASSDNANGYRNRVIGTGEAVKELLALPDSLGYSFWSTANFKNATSTTARYLTVNGYDPLYDSSATNYSTIKNTIPTANNGYLSNVTFTDLNNGNYPAWSVLRLVSSTAGYAYANNLATAAQNFISSSRPDFVPASSLTRVRSHFVPPSVTFSSTNTPNNGGSCGTEAGGDVGGVILALNTCTTGSRQ